MISALFVGFCVAVGVQLLYLLLVFSRTAFYPTAEPSSTPAPDITGPGPVQPGVSVVVCAWNERPNLEELLPQLAAQQYPNFEVIVVDDRSTDESYSFLHTFGQTFPPLRLVRVDRTPPHLAAKKYALTLGIKTAQHEIILLTDADCRPATPHWIAAMTACLTDSKEIVLGVSPYFKRRGVLNALIRFETFYTALQYVSLALVGMPYMGVGRNLLYRRAFFLKNRGFGSHYGMLGGDDDLFVNQTATAANTAVCLHPDSFVYSFAKTHWAQWFTQKRRHLSVSKRYGRRSQLVLGVLAASQVAAWVLFAVLIGLFAYRRDASGLAWTGGIWLLRLGTQWFIYARANQILARMLSAGWVPAYDAFLSIYSVGMGLVMTLFRKKITWR